MSNPLLNIGPQPDFATVTATHVTPALDELLARAEAALEQATHEATPAQYQALSRTLDVPVEALARAWGLVGHLQSVADTPEMRAARNENLPRVAAFFTRLASDGRLFAKYKAVPSDGLTPAQRRALSNTLRDFRLGGAELAGAAKERYAAIQQRLAELSQHFGEHVMDATDAYGLVVDEPRLAGVPDDVKRAARARAEAEGAAGFKLTLHMPCLVPVLQFADDRELRCTLYTANVQRASEYGPPELDNTALMREIVALRDEKARLLGQPSYAELSLVPKMARSSAEVMGFVRDLARRARPFGERDLAELRTFAAAQLGIADLEAWDIPYAAEKLRQQRHAFSSSEVKRYFTEPRVLQGLFELIARLFDVQMVEHAAPTWHDSVRYYRVERGGRLLGGFYLDLHARPGKQQGAWMVDAQQRWLRPDSGQLQLPLAYLICNFASPGDGKPALLSHDDVITLFHEFGHGLHHLLTQVDEASVSGIAGVEWDATELPSQFMENFCWEWDVLQRLTAHVDTGAPLPRELFEKMRAAKNFHSGLAMLRNCEYSLFDMRLHAEPVADVLQLMRSVRDEIAVVKPPAFQRFPNTFTHIFDGGYAAGYYSYAWAEVLSADAYAAFEEAGLADPATGRRYREAILEAGGSRPALESFVAFRGREPTLDALLRHNGLA